MPHPLRHPTRPNRQTSQINLFTTSYRDVYRQIRNYLAGRLLGATRDEALLQEVIKCMFCKLHLRNQSGQRPQPHDALELARQYRQAFADLRRLLPAVFGEHDELLLDPASLVYVDAMLDTIEIDHEARDCFGDAYEIFIGSSVRGQEGQFFTPLNAAKLLVSIVEPQPHERIIDPACGSGTFLSAAASRLISLGASPEEASLNIFGIDKDQYLAHLASARLSLITHAPSNIFCADSLAWAGEPGEHVPLEHEMGRFDIVLTNPPFGARIVAVSPEVQRSFDLGYRWMSDKHIGDFTKTQELQASVPPQVLFVERCLRLVRPGGRVGMVVPESLISGKNYRYVVQYIRTHADVRAVIGMPDSLFKTSGKGGTHTKTCLLFIVKRHPSDDTPPGKSVFMAEARWCGRDSRGRQIDYDDTPEIEAKYRQFSEGNLGIPTHLGYDVPSAQLAEQVLAPRYYNPDVAAGLSLLTDSHDLVKLGDLVASGLLTVTSGDEIGKLNYGSGPVPFVRTSDISNWELKLDPKHSVSEELHQSLATKQDVREGDILMVRDGTYLIGTCAFVTKYDTHIVFQSHLYKLRVNDWSRLSPYLLLAVLTSKPVQEQVKAKRFTQDIIDSLGDRIYELVLPIPRAASVRQRVTSTVKKAIEDRIQARELARKACVEVAAPPATARAGRQPAFPPNPTPNLT